MCPAPSQVAVPPVRVLKCGLLARFLETFHSWEQQGPQVRKPLPGLAGFQEAQVSLTPPVKSWAWASPLYLEHLEQVCSQPSGPDVHTGRAQRKLWIWPLKCILQFKNHIASSLPSPRGGGEGTKASLLLGFRGSQIQFQVCQGNLQGLGFSASTKRIQLISFYKQWDAHVPLEAPARAPSEASTLYNLDAGPDLKGKPACSSGPLATSVSHCCSSS